MGNRTETRRPSRRVDTQPRCGCEWSESLSHDELLQLETTGIDGFCALMAAWAAEDDANRSGTVSSFRFEEFVAEHNWSDPLRMYRLARSLSDTFDRYRREGAGTRTAFDHEVATVRCKAATLRAQGDAVLADDLDHDVDEIVAWIEVQLAARG